MFIQFKLTRKVLVQPYVVLPSTLPILLLSILIILNTHSKTIPTPHAFSPRFFQQRVAVIMHYFSTTDVMFLMHSLSFSMGELHPITPEAIRKEPRDTTEYTRWYNGRNPEFALDKCPNHGNIRLTSCCRTETTKYGADHFKTWKQCGVKTDLPIPLGRGNCKAISYVHNGPVAMWRTIPQRELFPPWAPCEDQDFNHRAAGVSKGVLVLETPLVCYTTPWGRFASAPGGSCTKTLASIRASLPILAAKAPWPALDTKDTKFVERRAKLLFPWHAPAKLPPQVNVLQEAADENGGDQTKACKAVKAKYAVRPGIEYGRLSGSVNIHMWGLWDCDHKSGG